VSGSGSIGISILLAFLDPDPDPYILKVPDPDPYLEYTDPQHCPKDKIKTDPLLDLEHCKTEFSFYVPVPYILHLTESCPISQRICPCKWFGNLADLSFLNRPRAV